MRDNKLARGGNWDTRRLFIQRDTKTAEQRNCKTGRLQDREIARQGD